VSRARQQRPAPSFLFSLAIRRPRESTLFPYTTLFRSAQCADAVSQVQKRWGRVDILVNNVGVGGPVGNAVDLDLMEWDKALRIKDRKSTRLNSSHVKISYAVFCLKKKKNKTYNL